MKKIKDFFDLIKLYFSFLFQKVTIIILSISFVLMTILLILIAASGYDYVYYLKNYIDIHSKYINEALLIVTLFNTIIASCMVISLFINSISFDHLYISYTKRRTLLISKALILFIVLAFITSIEVIIIYLIPTIKYPYFKIDGTILLVPMFIYLPLFTEVILLMTVSVIVPNIFVTMIMAFVAIADKLILANVSSIYNVFKYIIPSSYQSGIYIYSNALYMVPILGLLFFILYIKIYEIKDLA